MNTVDPRISDIPEEYYINDYRKLSDFKKMTYSGYQKSDVLSALQKSIMDQKVEEACHWAGEMLVSGHFMECWDRLIIINSKLINHANPNLPFYLWSRFVQALQISLEERNHGEKVLNLRKKIMIMLVQMIKTIQCFLTYINKNHQLNLQNHLFY